MNNKNTFAIKWRDGTDPCDPWAEMSFVKYDDIENMPTIEAEPVRHGEWIDTEPIYNYECHQSAHYKCSECSRRTGYKQTRNYNFCPKCGAKMDGDGEHE